MLYKAILMHMDIEVEVVEVVGLILSRNITKSLLFLSSAPVTRRPCAGTVPAAIPPSLRLGLTADSHASMSERSTRRHSRKLEMNGWCDSTHSDVRL